MTEWTYTYKDAMKQITKLIESSHNHGIISFISEDNNYNFSYEFKSKTFRFFNNEKTITPIQFKKETKNKDFKKICI